MAPASLPLLRAKAFASSSILLRCAAEVQTFLGIFVPVCLMRLHWMPLFTSLAVDFEAVSSPISEACARVAFSVVAGVVEQAASRVVAVSAAARASFWLLYWIVNFLPLQFRRRRWRRTKTAFAEKYYHSYAISQPKMRNYS